MLGTDKLRMKLVSLVIVISISASDAQDTSLVAQLKALQALALGKNQGVSESQLDIPLLQSVPPPPLPLSCSPS